MDAKSLIRIFGYSTASIVLIVGIAIIFGIVFPSFIPDNFRIIIGVVFVLYGGYRGMMLWVQQRYEKQNRG